MKGKTLMMKKTLILASLLALTISPAVMAQEAADTTKTEPAVKQECPQKPTCEKRKKAELEFEKRLKLTDEQIQKAKENRMKARKEMQPIKEQIKQKYGEIDAVKRSRMAVEMQNEKIAALKSEIRELKKQMHEIQIKNMKDFEALLTEKQLKELNKIKKEGRKKFEKEFKKHHKNKPCDFKPGYGPRPHPQGLEVPPPQPPVEK